jgi:hypothetical protein
VVAHRRDAGVWGIRPEKSAWWAKFEIATTAAETGIP